jgi:chemotaxis protein CheD
MEIAVGMGEIEVTESPHILMAVSIGSCVAVALYDVGAKIGGLAHIMLPHIADIQNRYHPTRFADFAIPTMIDEMKRRGAQFQNITAKIFGGGNMFPEIITPDSPLDVGKRNILAVREELKNRNIQITAEETGDHIGRTIIFNTGDGSVLIRSVYSGERIY